VKLLAIMIYEKNPIDKMRQGKNLRVAHSFLPFHHTLDFSSGTSDINDLAGLKPIKTDQSTIYHPP